MCIRDRSKDQSSDQNRDQQTVPSQTPAGEGARATQATPETTVSPKEAKELFRSVDEILQFASQDTGLPIKHKVKRRLAKRDEVQSYIEKSFKDDKDAKRLERSSEAVSYTHLDVYKRQIFLSRLAPQITQRDWTISAGQRQNRAAGDLAHFFFFRQNLRT